MWTEITSFIKRYIWDNTIFIVGLLFIVTLAFILILCKQPIKASNLLESFLAKFAHTFGTWLPKQRTTPIESTDEKGFSEQTIDTLPIKDDIFRDRTKVTVSDVVVDLPTGLQDKNVDTIIQSSIDATITHIENSAASESTKKVLEDASNTSISAQELLDNLNK